MPTLASMDVVGISLVGCVLALVIGRLGIARIGDAPNVFIHLYWRFELPFIGLAIAFAAGIIIVAARGGVRTPRTSVEAHFGIGRLNPALWIGALALGVLFLACYGSGRVMHHTPLSMDEFNTGFQARIFAAGSARAAIPLQWQPFGSALAPLFVRLDDSSSSWAAEYWPVYAIVRAGFVRLGLEPFTNPVLAALTVPVLWAAARHLWPGSRRPWFAVLALVTSSQFLVTSMTSYAMPAHLLFNVVWLYLFLRGDIVGVALAPLVGGLALGLHNPFPHALFAWPFLTRLVRQRRWEVTAYTTVVYAVAIGGWYYWLRSRTGYTEPAAVLSVFSMPDMLMWITQVASLVETLTWLSPFIAVALFAGIRAWRRVSPIESDIILGLLTTFTFYFFLDFPQGHGWGYRYLYPVLGNIALIAAMGASAIAETWSRRAVTRVALVSTVATIGLQFPLRTWQVEGFVGPFARGFEMIRESEAKIVIVNPDGLWYGRDLIRNDPFLAEPIVLRASSLTPGLRQRLAESYPGSIAEIGIEQLARAGWPTIR